MEGMSIISPHSNQIKKSALLWMSRFQKRLFHIVWEMWSHRNRILHDAGDKIHEDTLSSIDDDIRSEWERGLDDLPLRYAHLFSGSLAKNLQLIPNDKKRWLTSIWAARDKMNAGIKIWDRASVLNYDKWKARKTPQGQVKQASTVEGPVRRTQKLTIDTAHSSDSECDISDNDCGTALGNTPTATYNFDKDKDELTTSIKKHSASNIPHQAISPTGDLVQPNPIQQYICVPPNTQSDIQDFLQRSRPHNSIVSQINSETVSFHSLLTTKPHTWLNDEVINFFLSTLNQNDVREKEGTNSKRNHFFNSFFITRLLDEGNTDTYTYRNVRRWSRRVYMSDLFELGKIFFPCNISQSHWSCVITDMSSYTITYYDSMKGDGGRYMNSIFHYLQDDWHRTQGFELPEI
jgi:hypothetical protein